jgi:hypothetical protein
MDGTVLRGAVKGARRLVDGGGGVALGLAGNDFERLRHEALGDGSLWLLHRVAAGRGADLF